MDLEERSIEGLTDRCQSCGTQLTEAEKKVALERGSGVILCKTCAAEQVSLEDEATEDEAD